MKRKPKIIVIGGPTATGKSDLAVHLAMKFDGEVISADSRQVYKGLNIGTGKITKEEMRGIPHHLLDIANPNNQFSVQEFQKKGQTAIRRILKKGRVPIICGGTGFYIDALIYNTTFPNVLPNTSLRNALEQKSRDELFQMLNKKDPDRATTIDPHNKRRLIRALEIAEELGKNPTIKKESPYDVLYIALLPDELEKKIHDRLNKRIEHGLIKEARLLHKKGLSYRRMEELGLEYKYCARLLKNRISKEDFVLQLEKEIRNYAKRQMTWFRKQKNITWFKPKEINKIEKTINRFLGR